MTKKLPTPLFLLFFVFFSSTVFAQGNLMIMPKRLVFDGSQRSQEINLVNTGSDSATYAISFIQYKMTEDGEFVEIKEPEENQRFANDYLRYFPRRVNLGPDEAQTVRVQLTRSSNLEPGEYRSHFYFRAVEKQTALGEETQADSEGISIEIKTVFGISIPVIIRKGASTTQLEINELQLEKKEDKYELSMSLDREGNMSVYGNLEIEYLPPGGKPIEVSKVKGISVYTPNSKRNFKVVLPEMEGVNYHTGSLRVTYISDKGIKLAVSKIKLD